MGWGGMRGGDSAEGDVAIRSAVAGGASIGAREVISNRGSLLE